VDVGEEKDLPEGGRFLSKPCSPDLQRALIGGVQV
jgi:hypothetical protein